MNCISGDWEDKGYWASEEDDHVIMVGYKDKVLAVYHQWAATQEILDAVCQRHEARLVAATEAVL